MKKRDLLMLVLLLSSLAIAQSVDITPLSLYETTSAWQTVLVNNTGGASVITEVDAATPDVTITDAADYSGWTTVYNSTSAAWSGGTIETNTAEAWFAYEVLAPVVTSDTNGSIIATLTPGGAFPFVVTILNDDTPPQFSNVTPTQYVLANNPAQAISAIIVDPETDVASASYTWNDCSGANMTIALSNISSLYSGTVDFSTYNEEDTACYTFSSTNNGGEEGTYAGTLMFDGTPPIVSIISPTEYAGQITNFTFTASDNVATGLDCTVEFAGSSVGNVTIANGTTGSIVANLSAFAEGNQTWQVTCEDGVGLTDAESQNVILDLIAPTVTLLSPADGSHTQDTIIQTDTTDNYEIDTVNTNMAADTSGWPEGSNDYIVTATDKAGNQVVETFTFVIDRTAPTVTLVSPIGGATTDYHVSFVVNTADNLASTANCTVYANNLTGSASIPVGVDSNVDIITGLGNISWYATCLDEAGNSGTSIIETAVALDMTGPDISVDLSYVLKDEATSVPITVTDISGVASVVASFEGSQVTLTQNGDVYTGIIIASALGNTSIEVNATDTNGYNSTYVHTFPVIENYLITLSLSPSSANPGQTVYVSGTVTPSSGGTAAGNATLQAPGENITVTLVNGTYSTSFTAPSVGSYPVTLRYVVGSYAYSLTETLTVVIPEEEQGFTGSGFGFDVWRSEGHVKEDDSSGGSVEVEEAEEQEGPEPFVPEVDNGEVDESYEPLSPETPRSAYTPKATGVFDTSGTIKWVAILLGLALMVGLGIYGWNNYKPGSKDGINWDSYFKR